MAKILGIHEALKAIDNNRIINGGFHFWQRGTTFTSVASNTYTADRFRYFKNGSAVHTVQRSTDVSTTAIGTHSMDVLTTTLQSSIGASDFFFIQHRIEGTVLKTFRSKKMVLRFQVKSPKVGTHSVNIKNGDATRTNVLTYQVTQANTWETKTVRFTHDPTGTWNYDATIGVRVDFVLAVGSSIATSTIGTWQSGDFYGATAQVNVIDSLSSFKLSDIVLLEDNENQTREPDFKYAGQSYADELQLCQRYYEKSYEVATAPGTVTSNGQVFFRGTSTNHIFCTTFVTPKKAGTVTLTTYNPATGAAGSWRDVDATANRTPAATSASDGSFLVNISATVDGNALTGHWVADAEL